MTENDWRFIRSLRKILLAIQQEKSSIRDQQERWQQQQQVIADRPVNPPVVNVEVQVPEGVQGESSADRKKNRTIQIWLAVGTWLAFIAAGIYAGVAYQQKCAMLESNKINRAALTSVQRSFVSPSPVQTTKILTGKKFQGWLFRIGWENSGTTPAMGMFAHVNPVSQESDIAADFSFPDVFVGDGPRTPVEAAMGPKQTIVSSSYIVLPAKNAGAINSNPAKWFVYMYGWVTYRDVFFPLSATHLAEFCYHLTGFDGDPVVTGEGSPIWSICPQKPMCYDSDCKDYQQRTKH